MGLKYAKNALEAVLHPDPAGRAHLLMPSHDAHPFPILTLLQARDIILPYNGCCDSSWHRQKFSTGGAFLPVHSSFLLSCRTKSALLKIMMSEQLHVTGLGKDIKNKVMAMDLFGGQL